MNNGNKTTNIELSVDNTLCFQACLRILDIDPNNS